MKVKFLFPAGVVLSFFLLSILSTSALAGPSFFSDIETEFSGFLESRHGIQVQSPNDTLASETFVRLEGAAYTDALYAFASVDVSENHLMGDDSGLLLHEAYVDAAFGNLDLRMGRQIIIWGSSDATRITDQISPMDLSEYITRSFDEIRMGVDAVNLRYTWASGTTQFIWITRYRRAESPPTDSPWYLGDASQGKDVLPGPDSDPRDQTGTTFFDNGPSDSELALKHSLFLSGFDISLSHFYTWTDQPLYVFETDTSNAILARPRVLRQNITGLEFCKPFGENVLRMEAAWFWKDPVQTRPELSGIVKRSRFKWLVGLDWYPGDQWTIALEYAEQHILNHELGMFEPSVQRQIFIRGSKKVFREKLTLTGMVYFNPRVRDSLTRISGDYTPVDDLVFSLGLDVFTGGVGGRRGNYSPYDDKDQIWARIKYYF